MIDLTLNSILIPDITGYTQPFGTKVTRTTVNRGGLSTLEVNNNILASFLRMRPVVVDGSALTTSAIEYDAKLSIEAEQTVTLVLGTPTYKGCRVTVLNSSQFPQNVSAGSSTYAIEDEGGRLELTWNGSEWLVLGDSIAVCKSAANDSCIVHTAQSVQNGKSIRVMFENGHYDNNGTEMTLNVNALGAKKVYVNDKGTPVLFTGHVENTSEYWFIQALTTLEFVYMDSLDSGNGGYMILGHPVVYTKDAGSGYDTIYLA